MRACVVSLALQNNPPLLYARQQAVAADYAVNAALGQLFPTLTLQGQYQRSYDEVAKGIKINALSITAQVTIPLYQGGAEYCAIRKSKEQPSGRFQHCRRGTPDASSDADRQ